MTRWLTVLMVLAGLVVLPGCGDDQEGGVAERVEELRTRAEERIERLRKDTEGLRARAEERIERVRRDARRISRELEAKVREAFDDLERSVPRADESTRPPSRVGPQTKIDAFLTEVLGSVDGYWTTTLTAAGRPEPRVGYLWVPEGREARTGCGESADDTAAFYCPADDTIYVGQRLADGVFRGVVSGFPGEASQGRAVGDFGVAYLVAHEYAHNLQQELGVFDDRRRGASARPFELQADCLAGTWGASAYRAGRVKEGDVEEALSTALAVGDFEVGSEQHHGTPEERRDAWLLGFESGEPKDCSVYLGV